MIGRLQSHGLNLSIDFSAGRSLAITLDPDGPQPSFFAGKRARTSPLRVGDYIGDVSLGGSCNADVLEFIPHCHGTHTECWAHLDKSAGHVLDIIDQQPCLARLITLQGTPACDKGENKTILTLEELRKALGHGQTGHPKPLTGDALIIRTLPNPVEKMCRDYALEPSYPVLSAAAIDWLASQELKHLLLDTPSLDRANDGGKLSNHRCWWGLNPISSVTSVDPKKRSVTEMIYVPDALKDAHYWLHLELQPLASDATSSRPVIYPIKFDDAENSPANENLK